MAAEDYAADHAAALGGAQASPAQVAERLIRAHAPWASSTEQEWLVDRLTHNRELMMGRSTAGSLRVHELRRGRAANQWSREAFTAFMDRDFEAASHMTRNAMFIDPGRERVWQGHLDRIAVTAAGDGLTAASALTAGPRSPAREAGVELAQTDQTAAIDGAAASPAAIQAQESEPHEGPVTSAATDRPAPGQVGYVYVPGEQAATALADVSDALSRDDVEDLAAALRDVGVVGTDQDVRRFADELMASSKQEGSDPLDRVEARRAEAAGAAKIAQPVATGAVAEPLASAPAEDSAAVTDQEAVAVTAAPVAAAGLTAEAVAAARADADAAASAHDVDGLASALARMGVGGEEQDRSRIAAVLLREADKLPARLDELEVHGAAPDQRAAVQAAQQLRRAGAELPDQAVEADRSTAVGEPQSSTERDVASSATNRSAMDAAHDAAPAPAAPADSPVAALDESPTPAVDSELVLTLSRPRVMAALLKADVPGAQLLPGKTTVKVSDAAAFSHWLGMKEVETLAPGASDREKRMQSAAGTLIEQLGDALDAKQRTSDPAATEEAPQLTADATAASRSEGPSEELAADAREQTAGAALIPDQGGPGTDAHPAHAAAQLLAPSRAPRGAKPLNRPKAPPASAPAPVPARQR